MRNETPIDFLKAELDDHFRASSRRDALGSHGYLVSWDRSPGGWGWVARVSHEKYPETVEAEADTRMLAIHHALARLDRLKEARP